MLLKFQTKLESRTFSREKWYCYGSQEEAEGQANRFMVCPVPRPSFVYSISESILEGYAHYGTLSLVR